MLEYIEDIVRPIEQNPEVRTREQALQSLRALGIDDFGELLLSMPNPAYPKLASLLPQMASDEVQQHWTGGSGLSLLRQTCNFIRSAAYNFSRLTKHDLTNAAILDYGCGYGRMLRIMSYFTSEKNLYGVDPYMPSLEACQKCGLTDNIFLSDYLPTGLPLGNLTFDLIYAFSVFTHTSERSTRASLGVLRNYIADSGLLVITIRPVEFWSAVAGRDEETRRDMFGHHLGDEEFRNLMERHRSAGFAFEPLHTQPLIDGDVTYGQTSMTLDWICRNFRFWHIAGTDRSFDDPLQLYVFLKPA